MILNIGKVKRIVGSVAKTVNRHTAVW